MRAKATAKLPASAERLLLTLATTGELVARRGRAMRAAPAKPNDIALLLRCDLLVPRPDARLALTDAGRARALRTIAQRSAGALDPFLAQHLSLRPRIVEGPQGRAHVMVDDAESPLALLARRKGRDGTAWMTADQLAAGERLRAEFTRAQLTPRVTADWSAPVAQGRRAGGAAAAAQTDAALALRQRVRAALDAAGPEFAGLLLDVCCFLKGLEQVERERAWPPRSAKVVLQLGLDRLVRHYGMAREAHGRAKSHMRAWTAPVPLPAGEGPIADGG